MVSDGGVNLHPYIQDYETEAEAEVEPRFTIRPNGMGWGLEVGMRNPEALVIGGHYVTERDSAPVQYNGVVYYTAGTGTLNVLWL